MTVEELHQDMRDHPEKYDYADIPPINTSAAFKAYNKQMDALQPEWFKKLKEKNQPK